MKILVTGARGQLGRDVMEELRRRGDEPVGTGTQAADDAIPMDITRVEDVRRVLEAVRPEAVIHCAAWTAVDGAEDHAAACRVVNAEGTENIARICGGLGCKLLYISTDYVFGGEGTRPWEPDDPDKAPLNVYGQTKYEGELAVERNTDRFFTVRTSWVFGKNGKNFAATMLRLGRARDRLTVVDDQVGSPTYTPDLARLLGDMTHSERFGYYHASNEGFCSWYEFACEIFRQAGIGGVTVVPVTSAEYPVRARRPHNSRMDKSKLEQNGFRRLPPWQDALHRYLLEMGEIHG